jgi:hypothetical protein
MESQKSLELLWKQEADAVRYALPPDLLQSVPVSLVLYQPGHREGEAVYLAKDRIIRFPAGNQLQSAVLPGSGHAWKSRRVTVAAPHVKDYRSLVRKDLRKEIMEADRQRYIHDEDFDTDDPSISENAELVWQTVVPSPLWHGSGHWWTRLPRLGMAYAIHRDLLAFAGNDEDAAEKVLFVSAMALGNRALNARLDKLILEGKVVPVKDSPKLRTIANTICLEQSFDPDLALCLVMRLALSHHLFFPQSPRFLHILRVLEINPDKILTLHGGPAVGQPSEDEDLDQKKLTEYCDELSSDLYFLIEAAVRWDARGTRRHGTHRPSGDYVRNRVRLLMYQAIGLLAGDVAGYKNCARVEESPDIRVIEPPRALREIADGGLDVVGLSADFLKSTGKNDKEEKWPVEILQNMGVGNLVTDLDLRVGGSKPVPLLHFRSGVETAGEEHAEKRKWELTYLRARSAIFDQQRNPKNQEPPTSRAARK